MCAKMHLFWVNPPDTLSVLCEFVSLDHQSCKIRHKHQTTCNTELHTLHVSKQVPSV